MVRWLEKNVDEQAKIIDLGCGNGVMSLELVEAGFQHVHGVDYSQHAIDLAQKLAKESDLNLSPNGLNFTVILCATFRI